jgi:hypothetical protein
MRHVHFLHIGKCAGTQIKALAEKINATNSAVSITTHPHGIFLRNLPPNAEYFFSIRSPETRFLSGFYSRKRKGQPRYLVEWSANEKEAFGIFQDANDLAEALFAEGAEGANAFAAIMSIEHLALAQADYFRSAGFFLSKRPPLSIVRQEHFEEDIAVLYGRLGLASFPSVDHDPVAAHRNDYSGVKPLSEKALENISRWYAKDYELYRRCCEWLHGSQGMSSTTRG